MSNSVSLGKIFGIPIGLHYSWFIIFVVVTVGLALYIFPTISADWGTVTYWVAGVITSVLFFGSVLAHELAHSLVSRRFGVPVKSITLFIFGGVSAITREVDKPREELLMAGAGPASSIVLGILFGLIWLATRGVATPVAAAALYLGYINIGLGIFNLVPGFPLDGGRVFRSIVWGITGNYERATRIASALGQGFAYLLIIGGIFLVLTGNLANGLWLALIGWFMDNAASSSYRQLKLKEALKGHTASELMRAQCSQVSGDTSLSELVHGRVLSEGERCYMVTDQESLKGLVTLKEIKAVPQDKWTTVTVNDAMTKMDSLFTVPPDEEAYTVLEEMDARDVNQVPVVQDGKLLGTVTRDAILRLIRTKADLGI